MPTEIEWAHETWNPVTGCRKVSAGCRNCYAERVAKRLWKGRAFEDVQVHPDRLRVPHGWRRPRRVFVGSMTDLFQDGVPDSFVITLLAMLVELAPRHRFMVLTKRPARMRRLVAEVAARTGLRELPIAAGVSAENQITLVDRLPALLRTPVACRFVSCEPLLGWLDIREAWVPGLPVLDWLIVGGESGPGARVCDLDNVRLIEAQAVRAGLPVFLKQLGRRVRERGEDRQLRDYHGADPAEWPEDLRPPRREFPLFLALADGGGWCVDVAPAGGMSTRGQGASGGS